MIFSSVAVFHKQPTAYSFVGQKQRHCGLLMVLSLDFLFPHFFTFTFFSTMEKMQTYYTLIYQDFNQKRVETLGGENLDQVRNIIEHEPIRLSQAKKTTYYRYKITDRNLQEQSLEVENYYCSAGAEEYWITWRYDKEGGLEVSRYLNQVNHKALYPYMDKQKYAFYAPLSYNYANLPLKDYNPFNWGFGGLNFLNKMEDGKLITACGAKFSRVLIQSKHNNNFVLINVSDFPAKIVPILQYIDQFENISEFIIASNLALVNEYLKKLIADAQSTHIEAKWLVLSLVVLKSKMNFFIKKMYQYVPQNVKHEDYFVELLTEYTENIQKTEAVFCNHIPNYLELFEEAMKQKRIEKINGVWDFNEPSADIYLEKGIPLPEEPPYFIQM